MLKIAILAAALVSLNVAEGYPQQDNIVAMSRKEVDRKTMSPDTPKLDVLWYHEYTDINEKGASKTWMIDYSLDEPHKFAWNCPKLQNSQMKYKIKDSEGQWGDLVKLEDKNEDTLIFEVPSKGKAKLTVNWSRPRTPGQPILCCYDGDDGGYYSLPDSVCVECDADVACQITVMDV